MARAVFVGARVSLRTRLVLAFLLLAVVPLCAITLVSYLSSRRALRLAVEAEAAERARDMTERLDSVTADLGRRLATVADLPLDSLLHEMPADAREKVLGEVQARMGADAGLVDSLSIEPPSAPDSPEPAASTERDEADGMAAVPLPPAPAPAERVVVLAPAPPDPAQASLPAPDGSRWVVRVPQHVARIEELQHELTEARKAGDQAAAERAMSALATQSALLGMEAGRHALDNLSRMPWPGREAPGGAAPGAGSAPSPSPLAGPSPPADPVRPAQATPRGATKAAPPIAARERERAAPGRERAARQRGPARGERPSWWRGRRLDYALHRDGAAAGRVRADIKPQEVLARVFARTRSQQGEVPFAIDEAGALHAAEGDRAQLATLPWRELSGARPGEEVRRTYEEWVVVAQHDAVSGLILGIARPLGQSLREIRNAAFKNLASGLAIATVALLGILPLSRRMTRDLAILSAGAERLATGDLEARVTVRSKDEIGRLAGTFNRMAEELRANQDRLLAQERLRKELEMCRRIQEEMLPHESLRSSFVEVKGLSIPAREVGGDFFNYFLLQGNEAALLVGDVAGKGVAAALLMANLQATLRARLPREPDLAALARHLDLEIEAGTPAAAYLTLFMAVLDGAQGRLRYVNAGHNPPFLLRGDGRVEALDSTGRPLGLLPGGGYVQEEAALQKGDCLFLYTDGVVEAEDPTGEAFGMDRLQALLLSERQTGLDGILARVEEAVRGFRGGVEAADDATMVVLKFAGPERPA